MKLMDLLYPPTNNGNIHINKGALALTAISILYFLICDV